MCVIVQAKQVTQLSTFSGLVKLDYRIDDVCAMRVRHCNITVDNSPIPLPSCGAVWILRSANLGSRLVRSPFKIALSNDSAQPNATAVTNSDVIGWTTMADVFLNNASPITPGWAINEVRHFGKLETVEQFDWSFTPTDPTSFPNSGGNAYMIEIVIEFLTLRDYSSLGAVFSHDMECC